MAVLSKPITLPNSCYEIGHTWTPYCSRAALDVAMACYTEAFKIYGSLYLVAALLRRKDFEYWKKKLLHEILQSTLFLGSNGCLFITFFCIWRKVAGFFFFYNALVCGIPACALGLLFERKNRKLSGKLYMFTLAYLPALCASYFSILMERKSRRGLLAAYMSNVAVETGFRMLVSRRLVRPIKHGEVWLFSLITGVYLYLFRKRKGLSKSSVNFLKYLVGTYEIPLCSLHLDDERETTSQSRETTHKSKKTTSSIWTKISAMQQQVLSPLKHLPQHRLCKHPNSCVHYVLQGFLSSFSTGFVIQGGLKLLTSLSQMFKRPSVFLQALVHKDNFNFGAFLGSLSGIFRAVNCILRWIRDNDSEFHGLIAGFLAGFSMMFYKSIALSLYVGSKLAETLYFKGIDSKALPYIQCADIIIYSISTAFIFHAAVFEPHNLRPAYWKFLLRLTQNKFATMNRRVLDIFGTHASKLAPEHWPDYDENFSSLIRPVTDEVMFD